MSGWDEVGDGIFHRRYDPLDVSVCVVRGDDGLLLVDTRSSHREADEIRSHLTAFGRRAVRWVVNTHAHYDHTFGNFRFGTGSDVGAPIYGHERVPAHLVKFEEPMLARWIAEQRDPVADWRDVVITPPTELVGDHTFLDLGNRRVELVHLGRGHTDNDLLIHVPDANTWLVGDLVEESGPPMYGSGCFPLDWPDTTDLLHSRLGSDDIIVPGHGAPVRPEFVAEQNADLRAVADLIRSLHTAGVAAENAVAEGGDRWPFPTGGLQSAVVAGYAQLDRGEPPNPTPRS